jgi:DNA-binding IclR family transcriptional regulator
MVLTGPIEASAKPKPVVPAVASTLRILDYLAHVNPEARVSDVARALGLNKSTCFNILATLQADQVVVKHPTYASYRLGSKLVELGNAARRSLTQSFGLSEQIRTLSQEFDVTCVLAQTLADGSGMVVIDRSVPHRADVMALSIGHVVKMNGPAMGGALLASLDDAEAIDLARRNGLLSKNGESGLLGQLHQIRSVGYATSIGGRNPNVNAVAVVAGGPTDMELVVCALGFARDLPVSRIPEIGQRLVEVGRAARAPGHW